MASGGTVLKTKKQPSAEIRVTPLRIPDISVVPKTLLIRSFPIDPFDDRDSHNNYVNLSTIANEARELITVNYLTRERLEEYSYDAKGNRTQRLTNHDGRIESNPYTYYPNSDRIKSDGTYAYRYDANGNRTGKGTRYTDNGTDIEYSALEGEVWTYRYDPFNRLAEVRKSYEGTENLELAASYSYDHRSLRVQRTDREGISTCYAYSPQGKLLSEETDNVITEYIYLGNKLAAKRTAGRTLWYSTDHLGSTVMLTDESGEIVWSEGYTAFGEASGKTGYEISESGRYTGKDYDEATGLYYYNARWYDAALGRFLTEDPARDGANWYVYVRNNPLRYVDPTGLREIIDNDSSGRPEPVSPRDVKEAVREGRAERAERERIANQRGNDVGSPVNNYPKQPTSDSTKPPSDPNTTKQKNESDVDKIQDSVNNNIGPQGGTYGKGNQCDDWTKKVLDAAGVDTKSLYAGPTETTTVAEHIEAAIKNGQAKTSPSERWNLVFMDDSPEPYNYIPHAGLLKLNNDGSVEFYDQSSKNENQQPDKENYNSVEIFQYRYKYKRFIYIPTNSQ